MYAARTLKTTALAVALTLAPVVRPQSVQLTTIQGTVYCASGAAASGTLQISWPAFATAAGQAIAAGRINATLAVNGSLSVALAPNIGATPAGLFYTAVYHLSDGTTSTEYWSVPNTGQATIAQVRTKVMPAAQAVQAVSKAYVDQSIQQAVHSQITPSGGTLTGPLYLAADPASPLEPASKRYVDAAAARALPLSGGALQGPVTAPQIGAVYQADQFPGSDFGARLQACINALDPTYGGTCDARNFHGQLAMAANLNLSTGNVTIDLPCATIATAASILAPAGTRNVTLHGCASRGTSAASGSQGGTVLLYSGSSSLLQIGDPSFLADTKGFRLDNAALNTTASTSASAQAIALNRTQEISLASLYLLGNANQTALTLDGTGNYTGGSFQDLQFTGYQAAVNATGHTIDNPAPTDWLNASTFLRLHVTCPTQNGNPIPGTTGINLLSGDGNTFTGGDIESCATALHLGPHAQNNTFVGLRNENSTTQVLADSGSSYNNWITGGTMFTGKLTDNGTRNSFLDTFHRSFNALNGDWYGSQQDATVTNHLRLGIGTGAERGLLDRYQTDYGYRWTTGLSDASAGEQYYQVLDEFNSVYRLSIGQYNHDQSSTNNQTVLNAAGTGAVIFNGSNNAGTGGAVFGSGGPLSTTVATIDRSGNAHFTGTLLTDGTAQSAGTLTVRNDADSEVDYYLWPGSTTSQKGSFTYKDYDGSSQWFLLKDAANNWALNSATGGLDSFKAYQSTNSGDTYINAAKSSGHIRLNYETGSGAETDIYSGSSSSLAAAFLAPAAIKLPGLSAATGRNCLQIDNSGYLSNTGQSCGVATNVPSTGLTFPDNSVQTTSQQGALTGQANDSTARIAADAAQSAADNASTAAAAAQSAADTATAAANSALSGSANDSTARTAAASAQAAADTATTSAQAAQAAVTSALPANGAVSTGSGPANLVTFPGTVTAPNLTAGSATPVKLGDAGITYPDGTVQTTSAQADIIVDKYLSAADGHNAQDYCYAVNRAVASVPAGSRATLRATWGPKKVYSTCKFNKSVEMYWNGSYLLPQCTYDAVTNASAAWCAPPLVVPGVTVTPGNTQITLPAGTDMTQFQLGMRVGGVGIPQGSFINCIGVWSGATCSASGTTITLSLNPSLDFTGSTTAGNVTVRGVPMMNGLAAGMSVSASCNTGTINSRTISNLHYGGASPTDTQGFDLSSSTGVLTCTPAYFTAQSSWTSDLTFQAIAPVVVWENTRNGMEDAENFMLGAAEHDLYITDPQGWRVSHGMQGEQIIGLDGFKSFGARIVAIDGVARILGGYMDTATVQRSLQSTRENSFFDYQMYDDGELATGQAVDEIMTGAAGCPGNCFAGTDEINTIGFHGDIIAWPHGYGDVIGTYNSTNWGTDNGPRLLEFNGNSQREGGFHTNGTGSNSAYVYAPADMVLIYAGKTSTWHQALLQGGGYGHFVVRDLNGANMTFSGGTFGTGGGSLQYTVSVTGGSSTVTFVSGGGGSGFPANDYPNGKGMILSTPNEPGSPCQTGCNVYLGTTNAITADTRTITLAAPFQGTNATTYPDAVLNYGTGGYMTYFAAPGMGNAYPVITDATFWTPSAADLAVSGLTDLSQTFQGMNVHGMTYKAVFGLSYQFTYPALFAGPVNAYNGFVASNGAALGSDFYSFVQTNAGTASSSSFHGLSDKCTWNLSGSNNTIACLYANMTTTGSGYGATPKDRFLLQLQLNGADKYGIDLNGLQKLSLGTAIASASMIAPIAPITHITGTAGISTITVPSAVQSWMGCLKLIPDGAFTTTATGNIAQPSTAVPGKVLEECYDGTKWYPSY